MAKGKGSMKDRAKKKAERNMNRGGSSYLNLPEGTERFKPKKGTYNLDFLPYQVSVTTHPEVDKGELWYQRTFFVHYGIGNDSNAFICPKTIKKPCPICEHVKELFNSDDDNDVELAKDIKAKERELYNIINLDDQDKGVQLFEYSYHLFGKALDEEINEGDDDLGGFAELESGKTVSVSFRKKKFGSNEFFETRKIEFDDREDYEEDILDDVFDLDSLMVIQDYKTLQKALYDLDEEEEEEEEEKSSDDEEEEEKPKKSSSKKKNKKSSKKSSKKSKKKDDEDEEDDDEDEEEEKPKKSKSKKSSKKSSSKKNDKKKVAANECPYGHTFGEDVDEYDECGDCEKWADCQEASESDDENDDE